jgi:hypothetical protein
MNLRRLRSSHLVHVLGFATFPVVFLWAQNTDERIDIRSIVQALAIIWVVALAVYSTLRLSLRRQHLAAFLTSLALVLFFGFGHVRELADPSGIGSKDPLLFLEFGALLAIGTIFCLRAGKFTMGVTRTLNLIVSVLIVMNVVSVIAGGSLVSTPPAQAALPGVTVEQPENRRDVYYLIFDRYASGRTLREVYGYDNDPFLGSLRGDGFFVAEESLANYPKTAHSLAASLNMMYLDQIGASAGPDSDDWAPILASLQGSRTAMAFKELGYRYEHVGSWWEPTRLDPAADRSHDPEGVSEFSGVLLETTMWPALATGLGFDVSFERKQYERVQYQFNTVERIARDPKPTFTFAHFLLPHPPYVFDEEGGFVSPQEADSIGDGRAYLDQLRYTNSRISELVLDLLSGPDEDDPIIVIQSDEGPHPPGLIADETHYDWTLAGDPELGLKLRILNAYYLPGNGIDPYESISPVNTFRLIFSRYFGADLPLLEDRTFVYQDAAHPFRFTDVTSRLR